MLRRLQIFWKKERRRYFRQARVCVAYVTRLYDKTKVAQYASIIEEDDKARVKLL
jgi:hypothetical protein